MGRARGILLAVTALAALFVLWHSHVVPRLFSQKPSRFQRTSATPPASSLLLNPPPIVTANNNPPANPTPTTLPHSSQLSPPSTNFSPSPSLNPPPQAPSSETMPTLPPSLLSPLQTPHLAPTSGCSCYRVRNVYCCKQALCVCHSLCFNGSALLSAPTPQPTSGRNRQITGSLPPPCLPPQYTLNQIQPSLDGASSSSSGITDLLSPIPCSRKAEFAAYLNMALTEAPIRGGLHAASEDTWHKWVGPGGGNRDKGGSAEWRDGSTLLIPLDDPTTNVAHFIGKAAQILLVNNASTPTALPLITRFLLPRTPAAASRMRQHGQQGWIPSVLHVLLRIALEPLLNHTASSHHFPSLPRSPQSLADAISPEVLVGASTGAAASTGASRGGLEVLAGAVEFESAFSRASGAHPMCFHRLVLPGYLKAITFPGGMEQADMFKHRLKEAFPHPGPDPFRALASPDNASVGDVSAGSSSADGATVRLLYITRNASLTRGRRVMSEESSKALLNLFHQLNFQVAQVEFTPLTFAHQLALVQAADIIVSLHGAGLTNPASFARSDSVLLEISPYGVFYNLYYFMAVNAGVTYMLHQCTAGPAPMPAKDAEFQGVGPFPCDHDPACKQYRTHDRPVNLGKKDIEELGYLLAVARRLITDSKDEPQLSDLLLPSSLPFKRVQLEEKYPRGSQVRGGRHWKHLKQILQPHNLHDLPPDEANYVTIEAPPSMYPAKKYCDITGLEAPYTDPHSKLRYANPAAFAIARSLPHPHAQAFLALRGAQTIVKPTERFSGSLGHSPCHSLASPCCRYTAARCARARRGLAARAGGVATSGGGDSVGVVTLTDVIESGVGGMEGERRRDGVGSGEDRVGRGGVGSGSGENRFGNGSRVGMESDIPKVVWELEQETKDLLEWPIVCRQVARFADTVMGYREAEEGRLAVGRTWEESQALLLQTEAALLLPRRLDFNGAVDVGGLLSRLHRSAAPVGADNAAAAADVGDGIPEAASSGSDSDGDGSDSDATAAATAAPAPPMTITPSELLSVASLLQSGIDLGACIGLIPDETGILCPSSSSSFSSPTPSPLAPLTALLSSAATCPHLLLRIGTAINPRLKSLADSASAELAAIRAARRDNRRQLDESLQRAARRVVEGGGMDEAQVSRRRGRGCVAVRAGKKSAVTPGGVTLDVSNTGATLFVEPVEVIELNNNEAELSGQEAEEERRVLREMAEQVADCAPLIRDLTDRIVALDLACARARHALWMGASRPVLLPPTHPLSHGHGDNFSGVNTPGDTPSAAGDVS
ncbi:unnamed protein product [Closterium sp. NIES-54]